MKMGSVFISYYLLTYQITVSDFISISLTIVILL